ncbi:hypothetical protein VH567_03660 [Sphingomonas sp. 4RDLI-65]|uniref:hypothetical protein n=1 Tax=Sphingomonas sp. 4RDLI-65 TaxID=3111641 RepID=UPI003C278BE7
MAKQYWAQIIELDEEMTAATIPGATDHEDAADSLVADFVGAMGGEITAGAVRVWVQGGVEKVYDWKADFTMPDMDEMGDEDEMEVEGEIELIERV